MAADVMFLVLAYNLRKNHRNSADLAGFLRRTGFLRRNKKSLVSIGINTGALILGALVRPEPIFIINALMLIIWMVSDKRFEALAAKL